MICPCGSGRPFGRCCKAYIQGVKEAETPEVLMRSRYSAYAQGDMDYVARTWHSTTVPDSLQPDPQLHWIGLEVHGSGNGSSDSVTGWVEFSAQAIVGDELRVMHEKSRFVYEHGRWLYMDGEMITSAEMTSQRLGRNQACPCGSGKKFKRCCLR